MNIGFDLDGVLYDWHDVVYTYCVNNEGYAGSKSEFWKDYQDFPLDRKLNFERTTTFFSKKIPSKRVVDFLIELAKDNTLFYITSRKEDVKLTTELYLERYNFPDRDNLFFTDDKVTHIKLLDIEVFVDDLPSHLDSIGNSATTYLIRQPWNEEVCDNYNTIDSVTDLSSKFL